MLPSEIVLFSVRCTLVRFKILKMEGEVMYKQGDYVVKIPEGVCKIEYVGYLDIFGMKKDKEYYMLVPMNEKTSKIYVPVDHAGERIRKVVSKEDAIQFIKSIPDINEKDISNEKMREQEYKTAILSGNNESIVSIIKLLYARKQKRIEQGKKTTTIDDRYFKQAEDMLFSELSFVLDVPKENMEQFIADTLGA